MKNTKTPSIKNTLLITLAAISLMTGCGDDKEQAAENLFDLQFPSEAQTAEQKAALKSPSLTAAAVPGYYESQVSSDSVGQVRLKVEDNKVTLAIRCSKNDVVIKGQSSSAAELKTPNPYTLKIASPLATKVTEGNAYCFLRGVSEIPANATLRFVPTSGGTMLGIRDEKGATIGILMIEKKMDLEAKN